MDEQAAETPQMTPQKHRDCSTKISLWLCGILCLCGVNEFFRNLLEVPRDAFIATTTAVALIIDGVRIPFYLASHAESLSRHAPVIAMMTAGTLVGTIVGCAVLKGIPERLFRRVISGPIVALGLFMLLRSDLPR